MALTDEQFPMKQFQAVIAEIKRRLDVLERPTGTQVGSLVSQVQQAIINIGTTVTAYLASGFTTGSMTATGNGTFGGTLVGNVVKATTAPTTNITAARVAGWWQNSDGLAGTATSSERFKTDIRSMLDDPDFDPLAVLDLSIDYWRYIDEVRKRDDPSFDMYVGPDYHVALNFGPIAERAHELGLWMIVVYERETVYETRTETQQREVKDPDTGGIVVEEYEAEVEVPIREELRLDENGDPIPLALHDALFGYLLQMAVRVVRDQQVRDRADMEALAAHVGFILPSRAAGV